MEDLPAASAGRVVFSSFTENADIWSLRVDTRRGVVTGPLERLTENAAVDVQPSISGDGSRVAFTSNRAGNYDVFTKDLERGDEVPVTISATFESRPALSADGSLVAYNEGPIEKRRVLISSLRDAAGPVAANVCDDCFVPWDWSPDNRRLLYWPQNRKWIGLLDVQSRQTATILAHDPYTLLRASFSPDGRWIVFNADISSDRQQVFVALMRGMTPIDRASWIAVTKAEDRGHIARWSPDGNALYFLSNIDGYYCLWRQPLDPPTKQPIGDPVPLYHLHGARRSVSYVPVGFQESSVAPDRIVFSMSERTGNVWLGEWRP
jgi:Tol biopolymer transport system component